MGSVAAENGCLHAWFACLLRKAPLSTQLAPRAIPRKLRSLARCSFSAALHMHVHLGRRVGDQPTFHLCVQEKLDSLFGAGGPRGSVTFIRAIYFTRGPAVRVLACCWALAAGCSHQGWVLCSALLCTLARPPSVAAAALVCGPQRCLIRPPLMCRRSRCRPP